MIASAFFYEIPGLAPGAATEGVKKAYRSLVRRNHPDLFPPEAKELQELKMVQINEACARVKKRRIEYFNRLYRKILRNIEKRPRERRVSPG